MKIVFCALNFAYFRNFEPVVSALAMRGHRLHLVAEEEEERLGGRELMERLTATCPTVSWGPAPNVQGEPWFPVGRKLRHSLEYIRFLDPRYDRQRKVRQVAAQRAPLGLHWLLNVPLVNRRPGLGFLIAILKRLERAIPVSRRVVAFLQAERPDVVLLASLTYARSQQVDYLKAAQALGIRTAACVMGFDHLSSKALLHVVPDRVIVWNDTQRREAVDLHGIPDERILVTGAQCFDHWFGRQPSRTREAFCEEVGLDPQRPFLLYVCSAMSPDPHEATFVREWVDRIRASDDPTLGSIGILIRPHPERVKEWDNVTWPAGSTVALSGRNPIDPTARTEYYDALYHSRAVVGLVTTAFLDAAIVGRPVYTLLVPQFQMYQEEMQHFEYLVTVEGGVLRTARGFGEHLGQLSDLLAGSSEESARPERFLRAFVRPHGLDVPATPFFVEAVEHLASVEPTRACAPWWSSLLEPLVRRFALAAAGGWARRLMMDAAELGASRTEDENRRRKQEYVRAKEEKERELARIKEDRLRGKEELRREKERRRRQRMRNPRKIVARVKGRVKQLIGLEVR